MVSRPQRTDEATSPPDSLSEAQLSDFAENLPVAAANSNAVGANKKKGRAVAITFLIVSAVAMFGWLTGLGWAAISVVQWLF